MKTSISLCRRLLHAVVNNPLTEKPYNTAVITNSDCLPGPDCIICKYSQCVEEHDSESISKALWIMDDYKLQVKEIADLFIQYLDDCNFHKEDKKITKKSLENIYQLLFKLEAQHREQTKNLNFDDVYEEVKKRGCLVITEN